jgi:hypothetical protein
MNSFINENYTVLYTGEQVDRNNLASAKEFLLVDEPGSEGHKQVNALFVNIFAKEKDMVVVQNIPAFHLIESDEAVQSVWLKTEARIIGGDIGMPKQWMEEGLIRDLAELDLEDAIMKKEILECGEKLEDPLYKLFKKRMRLMSQDVFLMEHTKEQEAKVFQQRSASKMKVLNMKKTEIQRTFLMADRIHLDNNEEDPRFSLEKFKTSLKDRSVVILSPKEEAVKELGAVQNDLIEECFERFYKH